MIPVHVLTPFHRPENLAKIVANLEPQGVTWHPIVCIEDKPGGAVESFMSPPAARPWQHPAFLGNHPDRPNQADWVWAWKLNSWIVGEPPGESYDPIDDTALYAFLCDDSGYAPDFWVKVRAVAESSPEAGVFFVGCHRGQHVVGERNYGTFDLKCDPDHIRAGYTDLSQIVVRGSTLRAMRFQEQFAGHGLMAEWLQANYRAAYIPDAYALFNLYEPGRWDSTDPAHWLGAVEIPNPALAPPLTSPTPTSAASGLTILLVMPTAGHPAPEATHALYTARSERATVIWPPLIHGTSALCRCFNILWATALTMRDWGQITHVVMQHDDVAPAAGSLDIMLEILEQTGADLVAAVNSIKDGRGLTSTALDDPLNRFTTLKRLTMAEIHAPDLPDTFSAADFGWPDRAILANTGYWMADLRKPIFCTMEDEFPLIFTMRDRIVRDGNHWRADFEPEDWLFSRRMHELGGKIVCTRKVVTGHVGKQVFPNNFPWGSLKTDDCCMEADLRRVMEAALAQAAKGGEAAETVGNAIEDEGGRPIGAVIPGKIPPNRENCP